MIPGRPALLALLALACAARARVTDTKLRGDSRPLILLSEPFGFGVGGRINVTIDGLRLAAGKGGEPNLGRVGLFLTSGSVEDDLRQSLAEETCPLDPSNVALPIMTFQDAKGAGNASVATEGGAGESTDATEGGAGNVTAAAEDGAGGGGRKLLGGGRHLEEAEVTTGASSAGGAEGGDVDEAGAAEGGGAEGGEAVEAGRAGAEGARAAGGASLSASFVLFDLLANFQGGELSLFLANCNPEGAMLTADVQVAMYNLKGLTPDFLPIGEDALPLVYGTAATWFLGLGALWTATLLRASPESRLGIHWIMAALLGARCATLLTQAGMYHSLAEEGLPEGWGLAYRLATGARAALFSASVVLVAAGWSYMRRTLRNAEAGVLLLVVPVQALANVGIALLDGQAPGSPSTPPSLPLASASLDLRDLLHLVDAACCVAVLLPLAWQMRRLRAATDSDGKAARVLARLALFRTFYVVLVAYLYLTRVVVPVADALLPYWLSWITPALAELAALAFYVAVGSQFAPSDDVANPYFAREEEEIELVA